MLPRRLRLPRAGFAVQKAGKRRISSHFSLISAPALPKKGGVAFVVSKKTAPKSVDRHLLKRRALGALAPFASQDRAVVVHARAGAPSLSYAALRAELSALAQESGLKSR